MSNKIKEKVLPVKGSIIANGIKITVLKKNFCIEYPKKIWQQTPKKVKEVMLDNLTFGDTHFLPVTLGYNKIDYNTKFPITEPFLYRNQVMDMTKCEEWDNAPLLSYLQKFYNIDLNFARGSAAFMGSQDLKPFTNTRPTAIIPFSFGKESLLSFAMCREFGIKPVLVYSQEPSMPHEEEYKKKLIKEFSKRFKVDMYFVKNEPGLFRYDKAFKKKIGTEVGWGAQTTLVALQMLPFVYAYQAQYILFGSEYSNNEWHYRNGWKVFNSSDQTSLFTKHQDAMVRLLTGGYCGVSSTVEPIDQINIMDILHKRYPDIGKYQFSCTAEFPLTLGSQWCHRCYKCSRMFILAVCCNIDPKSIGFKYDMLQQPGLFTEYFGKAHKSGSAWDLDYAFYILYRRGVKSPYIQKFSETKLGKIKSWNFLNNYFTKLKPHYNLPEQYHKRILRIFNEELKELRKITK